MNKEVEKAAHELDAVVISSMSIGETEDLQNEHSSNSIHPTIIRVCVIYITCKIMLTIVDA